MAGFEDLEFCKLDVAREERTGFPEIVFGLGKTADQVEVIFSRIAEIHGRALVTRATREMAERIAKKYSSAEFDETSRLIRYGASPQKLPGKVAVLTGGTSDIPVAEEAAGTARRFIWIAYRESQGIWHCPPWLIWAPIPTISTAICPLCRSSRSRWNSYPSCGGELTPSG